MHIQGDLYFYMVILIFTINCWFVFHFFPEPFLPEFNTCHLPPPVLILLGSVFIPLLNNSVQASPVMYCYPCLPPAPHSPSLPPPSAHHTILFLRRSNPLCSSPLTLTPFFLIGWLGGERGVGQVPSSSPSLPSILLLNHLPPLLHLPCSHIPTIFLFLIFASLFVFPSPIAPPHGTLLYPLLLPLQLVLLRPFSMSCPVPLPRPSCTSSIAPLLQYISLLTFLLCSSLLQHLLLTVLYLRRFSSSSNVIISSSCFPRFFLPFLFFLNYFFCLPLFSSSPPLTFSGSLQYPLILHCSCTTSYSIASSHHFVRFTAVPRHPEAPGPPLHYRPHSPSTLCNVFCIEIL